MSIESWKSNIDKLICEFIDEQLLNDLPVRFVNKGDYEIEHHIDILNVCIISLFLEGRISVRIVIFGNNNYLILNTPLSEVTSSLLKDSWISTLESIHKTTARYYRYTINLIDQLKLRD